MRQKSRIALRDLLQKPLTSAYRSVECKVLSADDWTSGAVAELEAAGREDLNISFHVDGLRPNTTLQVRVLLLDKDLRSYQKVPYIVVHTAGQRELLRENFISLQTDNF